MSRLKAIKVHDLVYIDGLIGGDYENGWHIVSELSRPTGHHVVAHPLGNMDVRLFIPEGESAAILRHISTSGIPAALEALEAYERATQLAEVSNESPEALNEWIEASNDATTKVLAALRALRGEETK